jgi:hypothetical protein
MVDREVSAGTAAGPDQSDLSAHRGAAASRPSQTNPSAPASAAETSADRPRREGSAAERRAFWWGQKNDLVDKLLDERPDRAVRPVSVNDSTKLRDEALAERDDEGYRAENWATALREFLGWYNGYRTSHLVFNDPEGHRVRAPMPNSHQPQYGDTYYARLKAFERVALDRYDNPHVVMLTLTASSTNANGGWRCPADHLREIVDSFSTNVRPALHRAIDCDQWEYAKVLEHHKSGYGHMHVAIFCDGEVSEADFHPAIDAHLRNCDPAGTEAHNYHSPDPTERPISVNRVDPDLDPENYNADGPVGNLGSYVAEYVGSHGSELFDRDLPELMFRTVAWATPTQRVTFSPGANDMIDADRDDDQDDTEDGDADLDDPGSLGYVPGTTEDDVRRAATDDDRSVSELLDDPSDGWSLEGVGRVDDDGEEIHRVEQDPVRYDSVEDYSDLDPPEHIPFRRPRPPREDADLSQFG